MSLCLELGNFAAMGVYVRWALLCVALSGCQRWLSHPDVKPNEPGNKALVKTAQAQPQTVMNADHPDVPPAQSPSRWPTEDPNLPLDARYMRFVADFLHDWESSGAASVKDALPSDYEQSPGLHPNRLRNPRVEAAQMSFDHQSAIVTGTVELESEGQWFPAKVSVRCEKDRIVGLIFEKS